MRISPKIALDNLQTRDTKTHGCGLFPPHEGVKEALRITSLGRDVIAAWENRYEDTGAPNGIVVYYDLIIRIALVATDLSGDQIKQEGFVVLSTLDGAIRPDVLGAYNGGLELPFQTLKEAVRFVRYLNQ